MSDAEPVCGVSARRRAGHEGAPRRRRAAGPSTGRRRTVPWVALPKECSGAALLWRALEALSWERRWLVWVAPPRRPTARELRNRGLDVRHVLVVSLRPNLNPLPITEQALA